MKAPPIRQAPPVKPPPRLEILLRQDDATFAVPDWDTLREWIAENRIDTSAEVSTNEGPWQAISEHPETKSSFTKPVLTEPIAPEIPEATPPAPSATAEPSSAIPRA